MLAFLEACLGVGLLVSGAFLLVLATATYARELASIELIVVLAFLGAVSGDHLGFHLGRWIGPGFHHTGVARRYQDSLRKAELMIRRYGAMVVFIGRFVPAIRSVVPAMLGLSGFHPLRYLLLDVLACLLWSVALGAIIMGLDLGFGFGEP